MASVAFFCPQSKAPQDVYLNQLHSFLTQNKYLKSFLQNVISLKDVWETIAKERDDIAALDQGPAYVQKLSEWVKTGNSSLVSNQMSGILSLPLLVIIQVGQYFQYLEILGIKHAEFIAQLRKGGGLQGYCGGLAPAIAIACSKDEREVVENAAIAMRIALAIGAYGELGDDAAVPGATTIVVRTKRAGQADELVDKFPGTYISAVTDPKSVSIVGPVAVLAKLQSHARNQGLLVQEMYIRGKVHNPENAGLAEELCNLCDKTPSLQLPNARTLQAQVRSNKNGKPLTEGSLTHELVNVILASRCEWFTLLVEVAKDLDLSGRRTCSLLMFGIGDCVPLAPFHKLKLQITKLDVLSFISNHRSSAGKSIRDTDYSFPQDAVAIVGVSCRLPGANNIEELWDLVSNGLSRHEEVPKDRFDLHGSFRASQDLKFVQKRKFYGNFIDNARAFDHAFFRTNPKEAMNMDPQQRVLLELAYQAMESSGYLRSHKRESGDHIGCFIGASFVEYLDNTSSNPATAYTSTGTIRAFLSGKISYYFGWSGPSEVLDTACSSSLVAVNRACKAIQTGECTMALTGGVNMMTGINNYLDLAKAGFLSPTGQCKPFDKSADGYCRSEGGGLVVLKLLSQAVADQDQIFGVIPGVGTNQGGLSTSITIPHSPAQMKLYQTVLHQAAMKPDQVSYVEAHGTGTQAGDPLEIASIQEVFGGPDRSNLLNIGSLKGNIGHCETAAGVASLLKVVAMIHKRRIPPQASHKSLNPKIPALEPNRMCIASKANHWDAPLLAACVNSYGAAGSNAALICCEGPLNSILGGNSPVGYDDDSTYPIIVSSATKESLSKYTEILGQYLEKVVPRPRLGDLAYTLSERRRHDQHRYIIPASEITDLTESLKLMRNDDNAALEAPAKPKRVVLVFSGQSKTNVGLERGLYEAYPRLRSYVDSCNNILTSLGFPSILPAIFQSEPIQDIVVLQCSMFAMQSAFAMCWLDAGLEVSAVIGHSFGELTALVISGALSLLDGLKLVASRASLMAREWGPERGTMLVIQSSREVVQELIDEINARANLEIEVACYNSPSSQVIVSSASSISQVEEVLKGDQRFAEIRCQRLNVTHGFHSKFTTPILEKLDDVSRQLTFRKPEIPLESCSLEVLDQVQLDRPSKHAREPVYFGDAVRRVERRLGSSIWVEAGMNSPITAMVKQAVASPNDHIFLGMKTDGSQTPTNLVSNMTIKFWQQGIPISHWSFVSPKEYSCKQVWLPPYQFQPTPHWLTNVDRVIEAQNKIPEPLKFEQRPPEAPSKLVTTKNPINKDTPSADFQVHLATQRFTKIVSGHAVRQRPLCPAAMYMESAAMAAQILLGGFGTDTIFFRDLIFQAALGVDLDREVTLTLEKTESSKTWNFTVKSIPKSGLKPRSVVHAKGRIGLAPEPKLQVYERLISDSITELENKSNTEKLMSKRAYGLFSQVVSYAEFLQGISHISLDGRQAVAEINIPRVEIGTGESTASKVCDTVTLDVFIQVVGLLINSSELVSKDEVYVATGVESTTTSAECNFDTCKSWIVYTKFKPITADKAVGDVFVRTRDGTLLMTITGVQFTKLPISKLEQLLDSANPKVGQGTATKVEMIPKVQIASTEPSSTGTSDMMPDLSSATSVESDGGINTPGDDGEGSLKGILAEYTGISTIDIGDDANIGDLGVDSLAAVELAEELQSSFGQEVAAEDLLGFTYGELAKVCQVSASTKVIPKRSSNIALSIDNAVNSSPASEIDSNPTGRQDLYNILSETSGAPVASIKEGATLQELGVDSLSAVELKDDIETKFSVAIEDDMFVLDSTVKEILDFLGISRSQSSSRKPNATATTPKGPANEQPSTRSSHSSKMPILADPDEALAKCKELFNDAAAQRGFLNYWSDIAPMQDELLLAYISNAFQILGADLRFITPGGTVPTIQHLPKHEKVMDRLLQILEKHRIISRQGSRIIRGASKLPTKSPLELHESFLEHFPQYAGEARLMALTGPKLADCLRGKADAVSIMFKGSAAQKVMEDYYCNSPMLSTLTEQLATFMNEIAAKTDATTDSPIQILEVGAGFGGTTTRLAEVLQASGIPVEYTFTDISPSLVKNAKSKFAKYPWMKFETFNLEKDPLASQKDRFDIVIGTNCVHATTSKSASVGRLKQVLRKDGFIVLSEVTQIVDWYDIVFGLLDGWWLANDGSTYPLQPVESWMKSFADVGFRSTMYSKGSTPESNTQRLLVASQKEVSTPPQARIIATRGGVREYIVETVVYKEVDGIKILADIYLPRTPRGKAMPVALMIHGGGHMTLSRKAIRPAQTSYLLENGVLPISIDYRLCPEVNLIDGPMADVRDACGWVQSSSMTGLQTMLDSKGVKLQVDRRKFVMVGWSTGGHLAMTTAWTTKEAGLKPPCAILNFYSPTEFESGDLDRRRAEEYPERTKSMDEIIASLPTRPITSYDSNTVDTTGLGWVRPGDPRSELVLSLFKEGNGLPLMLNGLSGLSSQSSNIPTERAVIDPERVAAISPMLQLLHGKYDTPTFLIHGERDEIVPFHTAVRFADALSEHGVRTGLLAVTGARHIHDLKLVPGTDLWRTGVAPGYDFLFDVLDSNTT